jgi:putative serine/threonine protein kinase
LAKLSRQNISFSDDELGIGSADRLVRIISYPRFTEDAYAERLAEMRSLSVTSLVLGGRTIINSTRIAGKGCVGVVLKAKIGGKTCALKVRRVDADRKSMNEEARLHKIANDAGVGPRLEGHTKNLIAMEFIEGQSIVDWVSSATRKQVHGIARSVLEQCYSLDRAGLDHGELNRLDRHVIVGNNNNNKACIIDFESASTARKTSNITAAAQSIFLHGAVAGQVKKILGEVDRDAALAALRIYKRDQTDANLQAVLDSLQI